MIFNALSAGIVYLVTSLINLFPTLDVTIDLSNVADFIKRNIFDVIYYFVPLNFLLSCLFILVVVSRWDLIVKLARFIWSLIPFKSS